MGSILQLFPTSADRGIIDKPLPDGHTFLEVRMPRDNEPIVFYYLTEPVSMEGAESASYPPPDHVTGHTISRFDPPTETKVLIEKWRKVTYNLYPS